MDLCKLCRPRQKGKLMQRLDPRAKGCMLLGPPSPCGKPKLWHLEQHLQPWARKRHLPLLQPLACWYLGKLQQHHRRELDGLYLDRFCRKLLPPQLKLVICLVPVEGC